MSVVYHLGKGLGKFCFNVFGRLEITGRENVPPFGPLIVVVNHLSFTDPPVLVCSLPRKLSFLGKQELFANPVSRFAMRTFRVHPFDRSGLGVDAVRMAMRLLAQDEAVVVFPEGRRSPDHKLGDGLAGAAYMALRSQAPVLPVAITGTEKISGWRMMAPLTSFRLNIGQPFSLPVVEGTLSRGVVSNMRDLMMSRIAALLPPEYQGKWAATLTRRGKNGGDRVPQADSSAHR